MDVAKKFIQTYYQNVKISPNKRWIRFSNLNLFLRVSQQVMWRLPTV